MTTPKSEFERESLMSCMCPKYQDEIRLLHTKADLLERENEEFRRRVQYVINQIGTGNFTDRNIKEVLKDILNARCEKKSD